MKFLLSGRVRFVALLAVALAGVAVVSAAAAPRGANGQIAFGRFNPTLGDTQVYVVNPDGTGQRLVQGPTDVGEFPQWFPDGGHIATCCDLPGGGSRIINPDDGTFRDIDGQYPGLFNPCGSPSRNGTLLLCETFSDDGSQNGIHTIRSSEGGGLTQITSNPGGDDVPGSWSANGKRIVFQRFGPGQLRGRVRRERERHGPQADLAADGAGQLLLVRLVATGERNRVFTSRNARRAQLALDRAQRRHRAA